MEEVVEGGKETARVQDRLASKPQALSYNITQPEAATVCPRDWLPLLAPGCHLQPELRGLLPALSLCCTVEIPRNRYP